MKDLPALKIMNSPLVTVAPDASLSSALALMEKHRVHHLLVVEQGRMAGILSSADLLEIARALSLGGFHALPVLAIDDTPVGIVTSSDLVGLLLDQIERDSPRGVPGNTQPSEFANNAMPQLLEVLRAAEIFLHSGQSGQQHARLTRAVERARETAAA
jgi:predicted transcriptional regulator